MDSIPKLTSASVAHCWPVGEQEGRPCGEGTLERAGKCIPTPLRRKLFHRLSEATEKVKEGLDF